MMDKIAGEVYAWLQALWIFGVKNEDEVMLIHESLKVCLHVINKLFDTSGWSVFGPKHTSLNF
jgi:hypothetical protein